MTSKLHLQLWRTYNSHKKGKVYPTLKEICIIQKQQMERKSLTQSKTTFTQCKSRNCNNLSNFLNSCCSNEIWKLKRLLLDSPLSLQIKQTKNPKPDEVQENYI